ncbi:MAG: glycosyltransferase family 2 protein [Candidatus Nealsonbacteria bacterium]|nr:glycosyltransferase family 2 protein [Candidatus Nealsonbacteria bacterium]
MNEKLPFVSIIIPCRNEEKFIQKCLGSLVEQDYPKERLEILVADGSSEDKTREIAGGFVERYPFIKILNNPKKNTPSGLNIGIKGARGEFIARMDAHAEYEKEYISKCVKYIKEYGVDNIGGVMITISRKDTALGRAIVAVLSHPFGVGNAIFRIGAEKPILVDTVFGGFYKREVFERIGYFNENLHRGQDMEFNLRLRKSGGKILLVPEIKSFYYARSGFFSFWQHSFTDGAELISPLRLGVVIFSWRHLAPLVFVLGLIILSLLSFFSQKFLWLLIAFSGLYFLVNLYFSAMISFKEKDFRYLFFAPIAFTLLHIGYGLGSFYGLIKLFSSKSFLSKSSKKIKPTIKTNQ